MSEIQMDSIGIIRNILLLNKYPWNTLSDDFLFWMFQSENALIKTFNLLYLGGVLFKTALAKLSSLFPSVGNIQQVIIDGLKTRLEMCILVTKSTVNIDIFIDLFIGYLYYHLYCILKRIDYINLITMYLFDMTIEERSKKEREDVGHKSFHENLISSDNKKASTLSSPFMTNATSSENHNQTDKSNKEEHTFFTKSRKRITIRYPKDNLSSIPEETKQVSYIYEEIKENKTEIKHEETKESIPQAPPLVLPEEKDSNQTKLQEELSHSKLKKVEPNTREDNSLLSVLSKALEERKKKLSKDIEE